MNPPTYPARPHNGGPLDMAILAGTDYRGWSLEPKINGWRAIVHAPTRRMWNRHGESMSIEKEFDDALTQLVDLPAQFEWLDVEGLERRHKIMQGCLVVLDWITPGKTYKRRQDTLNAESGLWEMIIGEEANETFLENGTLRKVYLTSAYDWHSDVWDELQARNKALGVTFYEGVVAKKDNSLYPIQLRSSTEEFAQWVKHRFTTK